MQAMLSDSQSARSKRSSLEPATLSAADVFGLVGCSYGTGMELLRTGRFPLEPIKIGRQYRFRKSDVHELLGIDQRSAEDQPSRS